MLAQLAPPARPKVRAADAIAGPGGGAAAHPHQLLRDLHGRRAHPHRDPPPRRQPGARRTRLRADDRPVGIAARADDADHRRRRQEALRADHLGTGHAGAGGAAVRPAAARRPWPAPGNWSSTRRRWPTARCGGPSARSRRACSSSARTATRRCRSSTRSARRRRSTRRSDDELRALARTYLAYFGTYDVDPATKKIVVHTTSDFNPMNTGVDQIRFYEIDGDLLYLQPPPSAAGGQQSRITWRRVRSAPRGALTPSRVSARAALAFGRRSAR